MEKLLTVKQVAEHLNIDITTVYKWVDQNRLSFIDLGKEGGNRCLRFREKDIKELTDKNLVLNR